MQHIGHHTVYQPGSEERADGIVATVVLRGMMAAELRRRTSPTVTAVIAEAAGVAR